MAGADPREDGDRQVLADMARALFVVANGLVAFLLLGFTVAAISEALGPPPQGPDTVMPYLGVDDAAVLAIGALVACAGVGLSVRYWLLGSWHVVTVALAMVVVLVPLGGLLALTLSF